MRIEGWRRGAARLGRSRGLAKRPRQGQADIDAKDIRQPSASWRNISGNSAMDRARHGGDVRRSIYRDTWSKELGLRGEWDRPSIGEAVHLVDCRQLDAAPGRLQAVAPTAAR